MLLTSKWYHIKMFVTVDQVIRYSMEDIGKDCYLSTFYDLNRNSLDISKYIIQNEKNKIIFES